MTKDKRNHIQAMVDATKAVLDDDPKKPAKDKAPERKPATGKEASASARAAKILSRGDW